MINTEVFKIQLATNQLPKYSVDKHKGIIKQGDKNDFPSYLLFLYNNHSEHGQIVNRKADYVSGTNILQVGDNAQVDAFLKRANAFESWFELTKKTDLDDGIFGGHYLKVETNAQGTPLNWYHIPYSTVRVGDNLDTYEVCQDWSKYFSSETECYPQYKAGTIGTSIFFCKKYVPSINSIQSVYPQPEYLSCTLDIDTDIRIGSFFNNYVKNNFSAGTMITIYNGETDPVKKQNVVSRLTNEYTGEDEAGKTLVVFAPKDSKSSEVLTLNANDLDKQYQELTKRNKEKITAGHGVNGALFKIKMDDKALFSRDELIEQQELFMNEYVKVRQVDKLNRLSKWCKLNTGLVAEFEIEQVELIGLELPLDNQTVVNALNAKNPQIITDYIIKKYNVEIPETLDINGQPLPTETQATNDNLKGLSAADNADMYRIVRDFTKGKINEVLAIHRLQAYGIDENKAKAILGVDEVNIVQQSSQEKNSRIKELFLKYCHPIEDSEVLETVYLNDVKLADSSALTVSVTDLRSGILNQLKANPYLSVPELAKIYNVEDTVIQDSLKWLSEKSLVDITGDTFQPTEKAMNKETEITETEIYTEYTYQLRPDLSGQPLLLSTSRDDCREWVKLTWGTEKPSITSKPKYAITYEAIQNLTNEFGDSAWDFRGGFYNNKGEVTPWCRHIWEGQIKMRTKKK